MADPKERLTAEQRALVAQWQKSGVSQRVFAAKHGISKGSLAYWSACLRREAAARPTAPAAAPPAPAFVPVQMAAPPAPASDAHPFEVVLASGHVVRVGADFDAAALRRLVLALEADG